MSSCRSCISGIFAKEKNNSNLVRLASSYDYLIALAGNPNTGKSTLFNYLTGLRQHTGNWPGKTVSRAEGTFETANKKFKIIDLPGLYSLLPHSPDEEITRNFLLFKRPDCTVVVCDATALQRNLNLVLQILDITKKVVVCVNLIDEAARKHIKIDSKLLEIELGVPVVKCVAREGKGINTLIKKIHEISSGMIETSPPPVTLNPDTETLIGVISDRLKALNPNLETHRWLAMRLLAGDKEIEKALLNGEILSYSQPASLIPAK